MSVEEDSGREEEGILKCIPHESPEGGREPKIQQRKRKVWTQHREESRQRVR